MNCKEHILSNHYQAGYIGVGLSKNNKRTFHLVHRLVAKAFIPNPCGYNVVNHKDENSHNNRADNLEWCTQKYNVNYGTGNIRRTISNRITKGKQIDQYDFNGNLIDTLSSAHDKEPMFSATKIIACCKGKQKYHKGFIWVYHNDKPNLKVRAFCLWSKHK